MEEKPVEVQLPQETKNVLSSTDSAVHAMAEDVRSLGDTADYSKMTIEQLVKEVRKLRTENETFRFEVRKMIATEIEKQVRPLATQLDEFVAVKSKVVYTKYVLPKFDFLKFLRVK